MIDAGFGETQMNVWLSSMNMGTMTSALFKRYQRMVGEQVEELAMESCSDAIEEEKALTVNSNDVIQDE